MINASPRYSRLASATAPPWLKRKRQAGVVGVAGDERAGGDVDERDDDVDQRQPDERQDRQPGAAPEVDLDHLGDRLGVVAHRGDQRRRVVDRADEDHAEADPQEARQPAELLARQDRSDDRPGGGDRREVLPEEVERPGRHEVDAVGLAVGGGDGAVVERELRGDVATVEPIAEHQRGDHDRGQRRQSHERRSTSRGRAVNPAVPLPPLTTPGRAGRMRRL
jgi:hypothetical protein